MSLDLELVTARWVLGLWTGPELPGLAAQALEAGLDGAALRRLAGEATPLEAEVSDLFERALVELDAPRPSREESALIVARHHARAIVAGNVTPYLGAKAIWQEAFDLLRPEDHTLDPFVYWADEFEEASDAERRASCERAILESARDLAGS